MQLRSVPQGGDGALEAAMGGPVSAIFRCLRNLEAFPPWQSEAGEFAANAHKIIGQMHVPLLGIMSVYHTFIKISTGSWSIFELLMWFLWQSHLIARVQIRKSAATSAEEKARMCALLLVSHASCHQCLRAVSNMYLPTEILNDRMAFYCSRGSMVDAYMALLGFGISSSAIGLSKPYQMRLSAGMMLSFIVLWVQSIILTQNPCGWNVLFTNLASFLAGVIASHTVVSILRAQFCERNKLEQRIKEQAATIIQLSEDQPGAHSRCVHDVSDSVKTEFLELSVAYADSCCILSRLRVETTDPQEGEQLQLRWERSHAAFLWCLEHSGQAPVYQPVLPAHKATTGLLATQLPLIDKVQLFFAESRHALHLTGSMLRELLDAIHLGWYSVLCASVAALASVSPSPLLAALFTTAAAGLVLRVLGFVRESALIVCAGLFVSELIGTMASMLRTTSELQEQLELSTAPSSYQIMVPLWLGAGWTLGIQPLRPLVHNSFTVGIVMAQLLRMCALLHLQDGRVITHVATCTVIPFLTGTLISRYFTFFSGCHKVATQLNEAEELLSRSQCSYNELQDAHDRIEQLWQQLPDDKSARPNLPLAASQPILTNLTDGSMAGSSSAGLCVICFSKPYSHIYLPCRHRCVCADCAAKWASSSHRCPLCRAPSTSCSRVFDAS